MVVQPWNLGAASVFSRSKTKGRTELFDLLSCADAPKAAVDTSVFILLPISVAGHVCLLNVSKRDAV